MAENQEIAVKEFYVGSWKIKSINDNEFKLYYQDDIGAWVLNRGELQDLQHLIKRILEEG